MHRLSVLILLLGAFASLAVAASAPTFCKCTCFTNSTIIEIKPKSSTGGGSSSKPPPQHQPPSGGDTPTTTPTGPDPDPGGEDQQDALSFGSDLGEIIAAAEEDTIGVKLDRRQGRRAQRGSSSGSCSQCNRSFCLSQSLPICKGAADKDVSTMCFQRDSRKDQVIVWGFILGTAGLLGWAAVHKAVDMRQQRGAGIPGIGGLGRASGGGGGGLPPRGRRDGGGGGGGGGGVGGILPLGRGALGSTGADGGRGAYAAVAGHSRESSLQTN